MRALLLAGMVSGSAHVGAIFSLADAPAQRLVQRPMTMELI